MDRSTLEKRLAAIESRLSHLEKDLKSVPKPLECAARSSADEDIFPSSETSSSIYGKIKRPSNSYLLGVLAVICFVLAGGLLIKLSIDSGWLIPTPEKQIGMGAMLGLSLVFSRFIFSKIDKKYGNFPPCAGVIILYLTIFAAHLYHKLISFEPALGLLFLVSALCIWLYVQVRYKIFAIVAAIGAYLSPVGMQFNNSIDFTLYYYVVCSFTFAGISVWRSSKILMTVSAYLAILMSGLIGHTNKMLVAIILLVQFCIFTGGMYLHNRRNQLSLSNREALSFSPLLLIFYAMEYYFINSIAPGMAPWVSLGFVAIFLGAYLFAKKDSMDSSGSTHLILGFATVICFHSGYLELWPEDYKAWLFPIICSVFSLPYFNRDRKNYISKFYAPIFALILILVIEYIGMIYDLYLDRPNMDRLGVAFTSIVAMWMVIINSHKTGYGEISSVHPHSCSHPSYNGTLSFNNFYRGPCSLCLLVILCCWGNNICTYPQRCCYGKICSVGTFFSSRKGINI